MRTNKQSIVLFIILYLLSSCENLFHPEEISIGEIQNYDQLLTATGGVYGKLAETINEHFIYRINVRGDDLNENSPNYNGYYGTYEYCWEEYPYDERTYISWNLFYSVVASANNILSQYNTTSLLDEPTQEILGEMFFIRAYCYFRLTRTYGEVPIINNIDISYSTSRSSFVKIYEFIENDLKTAISLLPDDNSLSRIPYETPHRGTAKALLAELYLSCAGYPVNDISKYALAAREAEEVIDSAGYFGFGLVDDFSYLWDKQHLLNEEGIFTLYFAIPSKTENIEEINHIYVARAYEYPDFTSFMTDPESYFISSIFYCSELNFYNNYPSNYRKEITFYSTIYVPAEYAVGDTGYIQIENVDVCNRIGYRKFFYDPYEVPYSQYYEGDFNFNYYLGLPKIYILRYAHTLLTYAEASARSNQLNEKAYECVNMIRRRAHNVDLYTSSIYDLHPGLSPEAFADSVVWERAWELAGEPEGRWFDLVRLEMVEDLPNLRHPQEGGPPETFDKSAYFSPVPQGDIELNPNLGE